MENNEKISITVGVSDIAKQVLAEMQGERRFIRTIAEFLTAKETADFLNVDPSTLARWDKSGYFKPIRIGSRKMYRIEDIEKILQGKNEKQK